MTILDEEIKRLKYKMMGLEAFRKYLMNELYLVERMRDWARETDKSEAMEYYNKEKAWFDTQITKVIERIMVVSPLYFSLLDGKRRANL